MKATTSRYRVRRWIGIGLMSAVCVGASTSAKEQTMQARVSDAVRACQVGYLPDETKVAVLGEKPTGDVVLRNADGAEVLTVTPSEPLKSPDTGETIWQVDFSELREPGTYRLDVPGVGMSYPFAIGEDAFARPFRLAIRSFTGQRCGIAVSLAPDFPQYHHPACHLAPAQFHQSSGKTGEIDCTGGWHDAGDYNRYTVNSGITTGELLWAYELNADKLRDLNLDIPESGGDLPDFLAEVKWNLDWMLKMQDSGPGGDGGVWHKETSANFCGFVMPQDDNDPMLIVGSPDAPHKITTGTADLAAVAAIAARVYEPFDKAYADRCLAAARQAFAWCVEHPKALYQKQPEGINTGGYGDGDASDEMLWAAAELFRTTGEKTYHDYFLAHHDDWNLADQGAPGWPDVQVLGLLSYAMTDRDEVDAEVQAQLRKAALAGADRIAERVTANPYLMPLGSDEYYWGSNGVVANYGLMLRIANHIEPKQAYVDAAQDCLHYLFGRNTFDTSFVSQVGSKWVMNLHHRPSAADEIEQPWPGLMSGGPNANGKTPPASQWLDDAGRYDLNENAINWNAPLVFLLAEALPEAE